jgi:hypothetical protein
MRDITLDNAESSALTTGAETLAEDKDLAAIRDAAALAELPAEERAACERPWSDVAALLKKAGKEMK